MTSTVIKIRGLSKQYRIGDRDGRVYHSTLRSALASTFSLARKKTEKDENLFWALKDIDLDVHAGEVLGIVGANGAGKTTLLKILSGITDPTEGYAEVHGRISALLEVGTGFHSELTGRENVFVNAAILGMSRKETERVFDDIVAFAGVEKFIDTPIKFYSSGMQVRLAFSVAAHLEPEVMVIDEVLSVGDVAFQNKCLRRMDDVSTSGRTALFVSHNLSTVGRLCTRGILLDQGRIQTVGPISDVIATYLKSTNDTGPVKVIPKDERSPFQITQIFVSAGAEPSSIVDVGMPIDLHFQVHSRANQHVRFKVMLYSESGVEVAGETFSHAQMRNIDFRSGQSAEFKVTFPGNLLNVGAYFFRVLAKVKDFEYVEIQESNVFKVAVISAQNFSDDVSREGVIQASFKWDFRLD